MTALREKVTISVYYDELNLIEALKKRLSDSGLLVAPTTSAQEDQRDKLGIKGFLGLKKG